MGKERSPQQTDPWLKHMSIFALDPTVDDFLAEVAAYRQLQSVFINIVTDIKN